MASRSSQLRIASGRFAISSRLTTVPSDRGLGVEQRGHALDVNISPTAPSAREKSRLARGPVASATVCSRLWKPGGFDLHQVPPGKVHDQVGAVHSGCHVRDDARGQMVTVTGAPGPPRRTDP